jgi:CHAT domain-containing protein
VEVFSLDPGRDYTNPSLTDMVWTPVEQFLSGISDIYYTANGIFNSISFQALGLGGRSHLLDKYQFHLLSNISNIINVHDDRSTPSGRLLLAMWGDVDYGGKQESEDNAESVYRDIERGETLRHLTYSKDEIDAIQAIVERNNGTAIVFTDTLATEASFRSRAGKKDNILHISTHGFFSEDDAHKKDYNPMYNSGLFFAGADSTWNRIDTVFVSSAMVDDGILRADEIQYLDFSGCDLAVLSACKTGLGQSKNTEGVYGLQRAFKLAGVDKILMSLWSVNDKSTAEFMQVFYRYFYGGLSAEESLYKAQCDFYRANRSPYDWGAFVLLY